MPKSNLKTKLQELARKSGRWITSVRWGDAGLSTAAAAVRAVDKRAASKSFEPFDALEIEVTAAIAARLCRAEKHQLPDVSPEALARRVERYVLGMPQARAARFRNLLLVFEHQGLPVGSMRFTECDTAEQDAILEAWASSKRALRHDGFRQLKFVCMQAYWQQPSALRAIGIEGGLSTNVVEPV